MDKEIEASLTLLSMLAAVVKLNSAFDHTATAYMLRRQTSNTERAAQCPRVVM